MADKRVPAQYWQWYRSSASPVTVHWDMYYETLPKVDLLILVVIIIFVLSWRIVFIPLNFSETSVIDPRHTTLYISVSFLGCFQFYTRYYYIDDIYIIHHCAHIITLWHLFNVYRISWCIYLLFECPSGCSVICPPLPLDHHSLKCNNPSSPKIYYRLPCMPTIFCCMLFQTQCHNVQIETNI